jgi:mRNA interferase RelE/StbE
VAYEIETEPSVLRDLRRIQAADLRRITQKVDGLADDPRPAGCEKLSGSEAYRIRSGNFRIVYTVDDEQQVVTVTRIRHRRDVYRKD